MTFLNSISAVVESDITQIIDDIKVNKTSGPDKVSPRILKEAKHHISMPLRNLFSKPLNTGKVPLEWTLENVTPISEKGDKS